MPESVKKHFIGKIDKQVSVADSSNQEYAGEPDRGKHAESPVEIEIGGRKGLEPTRFGDWEKNGRCTDF